MSDKGFSFSIPPPSRAVTNFDQLSVILSKLSGSLTEIKVTLQNAMIFHNSNFSPVFNSAIARHICNKLEIKIEKGTKNRRNK